MILYRTLYLVLILMCAGACTRKVNPAKIEFFSWSIYAQSPAGHYNFRMNSNRVYLFSRHNHDTIRYGLLPEGIYNSLDSSLRLLAADKDFNRRSNSEFEPFIHAKVERSDGYFGFYHRIPASPEVQRIYDLIDEFGRHGHHNLNPDDSGWGVPTAPFFEPSK